MASHVRQQIRERIATVLTGLTTTGARVYQSRVYPLQAAELPGLLIYTQNEEIETMTMALPRTQRRTMRAVIEAVASGIANLDDTLDTICKEVEIALAADVTLNGLVKNSAIATVSIQLTGDPAQPVGTARMECALEYYTKENAPDVAI